MKATIILPTSIDRGPLLRFSVDSVLQQTESSWELFIVGDGVSDDTRDIATQLAASDSRISFFDYPKHASRGEEYRHELLQSARGDIVCYLCDRDLYLSNHVAQMFNLLQDCDFGHSLIVTPSPAGEFLYYGSIDISKPSHRQAVLSRLSGIPLSCTAHRRDAYQRLPHGWRSTPPGIPTDSYMWMQFLAMDSITAKSKLVPTVVYLRRGKHPGMPTHERAIELERYHQRFCRADGDLLYQEAINQQLVERESARDLAFQSSRFRRLRLKMAHMRGVWRPHITPK